MKVDYFNVPEISVSYKDNVKASERATIRCSKDAADILKVVFADCIQHHEEFYALFLNRANRLIGISLISKGGTSETVVDIKIILQTALKAHASAIMVSHCHPSGNTKPSSQDLDVTRKIAAGCKAIGMNMLDHLIVAEEGYLSFADEGLI